MRIAVVQGPFLPMPPLRGGAIERRWHNLVSEFARSGHDVTHYSRCFSDLPDREAVGSIRHIRVQGYDRPMSLGRALLLDFLYALRVRRAFEPSDVVVTHTFWMPILVPRSKSGPICVHVARMPKGQMGLYSRAERFHAVSAAVASEIVRQAPKLESRVKVFPNALSVDWDAGAQSSTLAREKSFLYVGRIHPEKGILLLLDAWAETYARLPGWKLDILGPFEVAAGGGGDQFRALITKKITEHGMENSITFHTPTYDTDRLKAHYDRASILVYPSLAEGGESFGMVPLEAMARGCVPVVSSLECFGEYVRSGKNAFVFDHRLQDPASELAALLVGASERVSEGMRDEGIRTGKKFTCENAAQRFLADFAVLIGESNNRRNSDVRQRGDEL